MADLSSDFINAEIDTRILLAINQGYTTPSEVDKMSYGEQEEWLIEHGYLGKAE